MNRRCLMMMAGLAFVFGTEPTPAGDPSKKSRDEKAQDRIVVAVFGDDPGSIGADAEESGLAERDDAGIAQDEVERQREQRKPHDVGHDQVARREDEGAGEREDPERDLAPVPASLPDRVISDVGLRAHGSPQAPMDGPRRSG